jgi:hypothetical protein
MDTIKYKKKGKGKEKRKTKKNKGGFPKIPIGSLKKSLKNMSNKLLNGMKKNPDILSDTLNPMQQPVQETSLQGTPLQGTPLQGTPLQGTPLQGTVIQTSTDKTAYEKAICENITRLFDKNATFFMERFIKKMDETIREELDKLPIQTQVTNRIASITDNFLDKATPEVQNKITDKIKTIIDTIVKDIINTTFANSLYKNLKDVDEKVKRQICDIKTI